jgi:DNA-binding Lrp family transcriptional regulator
VDTRVAQAVVRVSAGLILDQVRLGRGPLDFVDALVLMAVTQANVEPVLRDAELNRRYATYDQAPPDDLRRPISVNALSQSLGIPFETVRRRVARLATIGLYRVGPHGVIVPGWVLRISSHKAAAVAGYDRARTLYWRLVRLGARPEIPPATPWEGPPALRAVARSSADYLLRLVATTTAELGDVVNAAVWLEVLRSSHEHLPEAAGICGEDRRPVRISTVAKRIGIPHETARRRAAELVARGACELTREGVVLAPKAMDRPEFERIMSANHSDLNRMFATLGQLGIVAAWDAEAGGGA